MKHLLKYAWLIIAFSIILTLSVSGFLNKIQIDPDLKNMFPETMEAMVNTRQIEDCFGSQDMIMLIFETDDIINEQSLNRIKQIDRQLKRSKSFSKVTSLFGSNHIYGEDGIMYVEASVQRIPTNQQEISDIKKTLLANELVRNIVVSDDFKSAAIIATLTNHMPEDSIFLELNSIMEKYPGDEQIHIGGLPYIRQMVNNDIKRDGFILVPIALLLMIIFLYLVFKEWRGVFLPFLVVILASVFALALLPLFHWKFYIITILVPVILIAVANDYGIHIMAKYQEINSHGNKLGMKEIALKIFQELWKPIVLTGITTIAGISALLSHTMIPAREMAIASSIGIGLALFYSIILLPAILSVMKKSKPVLNHDQHQANKSMVLQNLAKWIIKKQVAIPRVSLLLFLALSMGIVFLKVNSNEENFFPGKHPVKKAAQLINKQYGGSQNISLMFEGDMKDPEVLHKIFSYKQELKKNKSIDIISCFPDLIIEISKALNDPETEYYNKIPRSKEAIAQYIELYNMSASQEDIDQIVDFNYTKSHMIIRVNNSSNHAVNEIIHEIQNLTQNDANLKAIGGYALVRSQLASAVVKGQFLSLGIALVIIFLLISIIFNSWKAGALSSIPLLMSIVFLFGLMGFARIHLDVATAMISSVMIGVGVDYTIHFLWRFREERRKTNSPEDALITTISTTGRGILFNALSVIIGFTVLLVSSFTPIRFFGILVVVSIISCLTGALVILPALVLKYDFRFLRPRNK